jgi:choline dehydrogenase-like flavoprotein
MQGEKAVTTHYDVIIIGSGAGGSTLAHHLAQSGKKILLLERGGWMTGEQEENRNAEEVFVFPVVGGGPGALATPINLTTMKNPELIEKLVAAIPLDRMAEPEEIASVVAFLAGDGSSYITATTIFADGGIMQSSPGL